MKTALVISGGGSHGAFAVGAIEVLWEKGWKFDIISGTSTGSLITSLAAINDIAKLVEIYTSVKTRNVLRLNWRRLFRDAIYDTKPLEKLIRKTMNGERFDKLMASEIIALICRVGFQSGNVLYGSQKSYETHSEIKAWGTFDGYVAAVLASTNEPTLMPPVLVDGEMCLDGGVREVAPFRIVKELGATKVVVIANSPEAPSTSSKTFDHIVDIGTRAIDLMSTEILNDEIYAAETESIIIRPIEQLPGSSLEFDPTLMQQMREIGQARAKEILG